MTRRTTFIGILIFSLVLTAALFALHEYEKHIYYLEDVDKVKQQLQVVFNAIYAFEGKQHRFPNTLQELLPDYLSAVPIPMYGEQTLWYHVNQTDRYFELITKNRFGTFVYSSTGYWTRNDSD